jgi:hypothetical protein
MTVYRMALGWVPPSQQRDLAKASALTLHSSSKAVCVTNYYPRSCVFLAFV